MYVCMYVYIYHTSNCIISVVAKMATDHIRITWIRAVKALKSMLSKSIKEHLSALPTLSVRILEWHGKISGYFPSNLSNVPAPPNVPAGLLPVHLHLTLVLYMQPTPYVVLMTKHFHMLPVCQAATRTNCFPSHFRVCHYFSCCMCGVKVEDSMNIGVQIRSSLFHNSMSSMCLQQ